MTATRASYRDISLYAPNRTPCPIDLSDNTNLWGVAPAVEAVLRGAATTSLTRYPSLYAERLKAAIAGYTGQPASRIVTGCGSDDVLDSAIRAFAEPGSRIAFPDPTFPMVPLFARMNGLVAVPVPLKPDYSLDVEGLLAADATIIYVCSPNNPTGNAVPPESLARLVASLRDDQALIIDEAYAEFADANALPLLADSGRVLISRTMSKAFGLAGLRIGYALGATDLVTEVEKSRGPYKVSSIAEQAAVAALEDGLAWAVERIADARAARATLMDALRDRDLNVVPSGSNFVFAPVRKGGAIATAMRARGVAIRPFEDLPQVSAGLGATGGSALRISVGPTEMIQAALAAFDEARAECE